MLVSRAGRQRVKEWAPFLFIFICVTFFQHAHAVLVFSTRAHELKLKMADVIEANNAGKHKQISKAF